MTSRKRVVITKPAFRALCEQHSGIQRHIAADLGVHRTTLYRWLERYPDERDHLRMGQIDLRDEAITTVRDNIRKGDQRAAEYVLDRIDEQGNWVLPGKRIDVTSGGQSILDILRSRGSDGADEE